MVIFKVGVGLIDNEQFIVKIMDNVTSFVPTDPANRDYQEYLAWVEEGNVAEEWNPEVN